MCLCHQWKSSQNKFLVGFAPILSDQCSETGSHFREPRYVLLISDSVLPGLIAHTQLWQHVRHRSSKFDWCRLRCAFSSWSSYWLLWLIMHCGLRVGNWVNGNQWWVIAVLVDDWSCKLWSWSKRLVSWLISGWNRCLLWPKTYPVPSLKDQSQGWNELDTDEFRQTILKCL